MPDSVVMHCCQLSEAVVATAVPEEQPNALGSEDCRILLAARAAVGDLLSGRAPNLQAHADPAVFPAGSPEARAAYRERLARVVRCEKVDGVDRIALLITALLEPERLVEHGPLPRPWRRWLPPSARAADEARRPRR